MSFAVGFEGVVLRRGQCGFHADTFGAGLHAIHTRGPREIRARAQFNPSLQKPRRNIHGFVLR